MITLLSPSKKLNFKQQDAVSVFTQCDFIESAQELINQAKNLTSQDLKDLMKIFFTMNKPIHTISTSPNEFKTQFKS